MGRCCVCNKEVDFWHSNQLKDGEICDECYVALNQIDNTMDKLKLSKSKCDDIVDVVSKNSDLNNANDKEGDISDNFDSDTCMSTNTSELSEVLYDAEVSGILNEACDGENINIFSESCNRIECDSGKINKPKKEKSTIGRVLNVIEIIVIVFGLYLWLSGNLEVFMMDIIAEINSDSATDNPYIQMVYALKPNGTSQTYGRVFSDALAQNRWSYFKNNGMRYVKVSSKFEANDSDVLETFFTLTPAEEKGEFWIEVNSMRYGGDVLSEFEMSMVMAELYEDDLGSLFADALIDSMFN